MQLENTFDVPVPAAQAWDVLLDIHRVAPCMPGATLDSVDGDEFAGRIRVKVGPITMSYRGTARFATRDADRRVAVIEAAGNETRGSGTARATITTELHDQGASTQVRVRTDLTITGRPAQFGRGVLAEVSGKLIDQFAKCLAREVTGETPAPATPPPAPPAPSPAPPPSPEAPAGAPAAPPAATAEPEAPAPPPPPAAQPEAPAPPPPPAAEPEAPAPPPPPAAEPEAPAPPAPPGPVPPPHPAAAEPINLLGVAGGAVLKRAVPAAVGLALLAWLVSRWLRRRR